MTDSFSRRNVVAGGLMLGAAALAYARTPQSTAPRSKKGAIDAALPKQIGGWAFESTSGLVLPPPDSLSDRLYDEIATRVYVGPDLPPVMMLIAYSNVQDGMLQVHRPETCYPVGGFELSDPRIVDLGVGGGRSIPCRFFTASGVSRTEQVMYWTRIGDEIPGRWLDQRMAVVRANLRGEVPDGVLVRLSMVGPDAAAAIPMLQRFAVGMLGGVPAPTRRLLVG
jgi:EpsI family protein